MMTPKATAEQIARDQGFDEVIIIGHRSGQGGNIVTYRADETKDRSGLLNALHRFLRRLSWV